MNQLMKEDLSQSITTIPYTDNNTVYNPVAVDDKEGRLAIRANIDNYEAVLHKMVDEGAEEMGDEVNENGLNEYFADGAYIRSLMIPKDLTVVSQIWKKERMWIIATGEVTITTELGTRRVKAPYTEVVPAGIKVALYTHEDTLWFAITGSGDADKDTIKEEVIANDYNECVLPWDTLEECKV